MIVPADVLARFWAKVTLAPGCWEWRGARCSKGYGSFGFAKKIWGAHRLSMLIEHGAIPPDAQVLHHCDNPGCVNPAHLYFGTHHQNMADRNSRGRARGGRNFGELAPSSRLRAEDVRNIRALATAGYRQQDLAEAWGVHKATVNDAVLRKTWGHI